MRFLAAAFLAITIFIAPTAMTMAAQGSPSQTSSSGPHNFGGLNCPQRVPCPGVLTSMPSSSDLAANANACVTQYLGIADSGDGFFDKDLGLDSNNCLSSNSAAKQMANRTAPHCCVIKANDSTCLFRCELVQ